MTPDYEAAFLRLAMCYMHLALHVADLGDETASIDANRKLDRIAQELNLGPEELVSRAWDRMQQDLQEAPMP